jgi:polar amino acid transport system substrate-binding protein
MRSRLSSPRARRLRGSLFCAALAISAFTALIMTSWSALVRAGEAPIRLVADVWPPFTDVEGNPRDAIDVVESALLRGGLRSEFKIETWSSAMRLLEQGKVDGAPAMWKDPAREKYLLFSKPYLENRLVLVGRKGSDVAAASIDAIQGSLALTRGYAYGDTVTKTEKGQRIYCDDDAACLRLVLAKRADYLLLDELLVRHLFRLDKARAEKLLSVGQVPLVTRALHFALRAKHPHAAEIIAAFDRNIAGMIADGTYNRVLHVPWVQADVDGDGVAEYVGSAQVVSKTDTDPNVSNASYPIFGGPSASAPAAAGAGRIPDRSVHRAPAYLIDGKSYNSWGDAASALPGAEVAPEDGMYKYATGIVLGEF